MEQTVEHLHRVAVLIPQLGADTQRAGGGEKVAVRLANGIAAQGIPVDLVTLSAGGIFLDELSAEVRTVCLEGNLLARLRRMAAYLRAEAPQAVFAQDNQAGLLALLARRLSKANVQIFVTIHDTLSRRWSNFGPVRRAAFPYLARWYYRTFRVDGMIGVSRAAADDLKALLRVPESRVHAIYNPIISDDLFQQGGKETDPMITDSNGVPLILGVGRLRKQKGFSNLIRAFARVRSKQPVRLLILGEGEQRSELQRLVSDVGLQEDVMLPGFVKNPYPYITRADVFVLSSLWEGLPTVLVEALALGTPIVATNCPSGPAEILDNGKWGRLVPVGDEEALGAAIIDTLHELHKAVPSEAWAPYTVSVAVEKYMSLLLHNEPWQKTRRKTHSNARSSARSSSCLDDREAV